MKTIGALFCFCLLVCSMGCTAKRDGPYVLDSSDPEALNPELTWAVITDPYVAFQEEPGWTSGVSGHARTGEYFAIIGNATVTIDEVTERWYKVADGWLPSKSMTICNNKMLAASTAALLRKSSQ